MAEMSNISTVAFDAAAAWASLDAETQARIGAAALDVAVAGAIMNHALDPASRAGMEAERLALEALAEVALGIGGLRNAEWIDPAPFFDPVSEMFRIPAVLGLVCHACGCSECDPCPEGCGWASDKLCTACVLEVPHG